MAVGLLFCQRSGEYWLQMFDSFTGTLPLLFIGFFELIGVSWVYGANRWETRNSSATPSTWFVHEVQVR